MSTVVDKLNYLNETKELLKAEFIKYGVELTDEAFRSYPDFVKEIYTNIFKHSGQNTGFFYGVETLEEIPLIETSATTIANMFRECGVTKIHGLIAKDTTSFTHGFRESYYLTEITRLDLSSSTNLGSSFNNCRSLTKIGWEGLIKADLTISACPLDHNSLIAIINCLDANNPNNLVIGANNIAKLTSEELAIATNKGWTVS